MIKQWCKDIFTEDDGQSICTAKTMALVAFISYLGYAGYGLYGGHFDITAYGQGLMMVMIGSGTIIAGKQLTQKSG